MKNKFNDNDIKEFIRLYQEGNSLSKIALSYSTTRHTISKYLKENNIEIDNGFFKNKYSFDKTFFKKIDTEEKAYILGFIFADGNITKNNVFQLCLSEIDVDVLIKINKAINSSYPIYSRPSHGGYINARPQKYIRITSKELYNDLYKLNVKNKDHIKKLIPKELFRHFIRGVFDGDGCIAKYSRKNECEFYIMAEKTLLFEFIDEFALNNINFKSPKYIKNIYKIRKSGILNIIKIYDFLYKDATIYLDRKYNKWGEILNDKQE